MFDYINALLVQHPELLVKLKFLLMLKYWCFLILSGIFLYIERVAEIDDRGHAFLSERSCSAT
jgi:hypothetical protein